MSLATWKAEFYPTEAKDCPADQAIEHSLVKWRGLRAEALQRHDVTADHKAFHKTLRDSSTSGWQRIDDSTCALCVHHLRDSDGNYSCKGCPLSAVRSGYACDHRNGVIELLSPWSYWSDHADPEPMIAALEKALAEQGSKS